MSDYIKIGDAGVIAHNQISLVRRNGNLIEVMAAGLTNPVIFRFESTDAAQKVLADVMRQLDSDSSGYRFFKSPDGCRTYYAVPASGEQTGRSFFSCSDCGVRLGESRWSLAEMLQEPSDEEITQQQFETAFGTDWRSRL